uniref:Uncharacterized protein n=1 Tax=Avena sativa TaxID=4498 RepID=A0ACD5ZA86_AVESA
MQARVVVFPIRRGAWCFIRPRAPAPATSASAASHGALPLPPPPKLRGLWRGIAAGGRTAPENAEAVTDFVADKVLDEMSLVVVSLSVCGVGADEMIGFW